MSIFRWMNETYLQQIHLFCFSCDSRLRSEATQKFRGKANGEEFMDGI